jgi:6-phosphogluconate dehydrogenase
MQMIAEIYGVLRDGLGMKPKEIAPVFAKWNKGRSTPTSSRSPRRCWKRPIRRPKKPVVDIILDRAGQKGTGQVVGHRGAEARRAGNRHRGAVAARVISSMKAEREAAEKAYGKAKKPKLDISDRRRC